MFSLANILTILNLFCGCIAILQVVQNKPGWAIIFLGLCLLFDFLDGFVARWMKQESEIGIQLDSLADVVSFGVLPGMMLYFIFIEHLSSFGYPSYLANSAFLISCFATFRLARFNVEADGKVHDFQGLPVPAMAIFISGIYASFYLQGLSTNFIYHPLVIMGIIGLLSYLMLSRISILKVLLNIHFIKNNWMLFILYIVCLIFIFNSHFIFLSVLIIGHIGYSLIQQYFKKI